MAANPEIKIELGLMIHLINALKHAIDVIEAYQGEIRCYDDDRYAGQTLAEEGFCQGTMFKNAVPTINKILCGKEVECTKKY